MCREGIRKCCISFAINMGMVMILFWYILQMFLLLSEFSAKHDDKWTTVVIVSMYESRKVLVISALSIGVLLTYVGIVSRIGYLMIPLICLEVILSGYRFMDLYSRCMKSKLYPDEGWIILGIHWYVIFIQCCYYRGLMKEKVRHIPLEAAKSSTNAPSSRIDPSSPNSGLHYDRTLITFPSAPTVPSANRPRFSYEPDIETPTGLVSNSGWRSGETAEYPVFSENIGLEMLPPSYNDVVSVRRS